MTQVLGARGGQRVCVSSAEHAYDVVLGSGILTRLEGIEGISNLLEGRRVFIATDSTVWDLHGTSLVRGLEQAKAVILGHCAMEPGESNKHLGSLSDYWDALLDVEIERGDLLIAFGGGVVGDVAGFAAATCLRGVEFLQVPTTLLAMVDSSVGGKTGIDHARGKNLIGAFHQPVGVVADLALLATLPQREVVSGLAEVLKAAILGDRELFELLERRGPTLADVPDELLEVVRRAVMLKARVVQADEREAGERALLNLGHTLGHALEVVSGYGTWLHGEAVALGIGFSAALSGKLGYCSEAVVRRIRSLMENWGYPLRARGFPAEKVLDALRHDKKNRDGATQWVLVRDIGDAQWGVTVPERVVADLLSEVLIEP